MKQEEQGFMIVAFTAQGFSLAEKLWDAFASCGRQSDICISQKLAERIMETGAAVVLKEPLQKWLEKKWNDYQGIVFVSATGIAVRMIAPFLRDKKQDPAVVVLDERGKFAISLVSGHVGGANALAAFLAEETGAVPVITTATDVEGRFAVDLFAKRNGLKLSDPVLAKEITAELLHGEKIGFYADIPVEGMVPEGVVPVKTMSELQNFRYGIAVQKRWNSTENVSENVGDRKNASGASGKTLYLWRRELVLGIGCRKGITCEQLREAIGQAEQEGLFLSEEIGMLASIDLKAEEEGILKLARFLHVPFVTFSAEELKTVEGVSEESAFVVSVTGVGNVCERAAILGAGAKTAEIKKRKYCQITLAGARKRGKIRFE